MAKSTDNPTSLVPETHPFDVRLVLWHAFNSLTSKRFSPSPPPRPVTPNPPRPVLWYEFHFNHSKALYTVKIILSQGLLTIIGFTSFWLNPVCGERISLAITMCVVPL